MWSELLGHVNSKKLVNNIQIGIYFSSIIIYNIPSISFFQIIYILVTITHYLVLPFSLTYRLQIKIQQQNTQIKYFVYASVLFIIFSHPDADILLCIETQYVYSLICYLFVCCGMLANILISFDYFIGAYYRSRESSSNWT